MKMQDLHGKVAVITGASSGIGEATARLLVDEGVHVMLVGRRKERIDALAADLGPLAVAVAGDVADPVQVRAIFDKVREQFGGLDLLFNNAGLGIYSPFETSDPADWKQMIEPGAVWTEFGHNVDAVLQERRAALDALTSEDVAQALVYAFAQPPRVLVEEILIRPVKQVAP